MFMHRYYFPNTYLNHPNYILQSIAMSKTAETYVCTCRLFMLQTIIQYRLWHASHCQFGKKVNFPVFCFFSLFIAVIHSNFFPRQQWKQARNVFTLKCIISFQKKLPPWRHSNVISYNATTTTAVTMSHTQVQIGNKICSKQQQKYSNGSYSEV